MTILKSWYLLRIRIFVFQDVRSYHLLTLLQYLFVKNVAIYSFSIDLVVSLYTVSEAPLICPGFVEATYTVCLKKKKKTYGVAK